MGLGSGQDRGLLWASLAFPGATVLGSVVAIREEVPGRPLGVGVPLSVAAGVAADRGPV
jgi:hypothetical protein